MIQPWQIWLASLDPTSGRELSGTRPVVVVSSELQIRSESGRSVIICPITSRERNVRNHVPITDLKGDINYVMTEQLRYLSTSRFVYTEPWWTLGEDEIRDVRRILPFMLDLP